MPLLYRPIDRLRPRRNVHAMPFQPPLEPEASRKAVRLCSFSLPMEFLRPLPRCSKQTHNLRLTRNIVGRLAGCIGQLRIRASFEQQAHNLCITML